MAAGFYVIQAGNKLYSVDLAGAGTELTLPGGITIDATRPLRAAMLNRQLVLCGSPSDTLWLDPYGTLRRLAMKAPPSPPTLASGGAGALTGSYRGKFTNIIRDKVTKAVVAESPFSPISAATAALASNSIAWTNVAVAGPMTAAPSARRLYRTTSGPGESYFRNVDVDGNERILVTNNMTDTRLGLIAAPTDLGTPSGPFELVCEWKDRLWAKAYNAIDNLAYSANRKHYAWPPTNYAPIRPAGGDLTGITALVPRRDELGVSRLNVFWKVIGDPPNIQVVKVFEGKGVIAPDSVIIIDDIAYMLFRDGVYTWGPRGLECITNNDVKPWFSTDTYFNRSRFPVAFGRYNEYLHAYELHLANVGDSSENRWIAYHIAEQKWLGPHSTAAATPSSSFVLQDSNGVRFAVIGDSAGFMWKMNQTSRSDGGSAIDFNLKLRHNQEPDLEKVFGEMSIFTKAELAGTLTITPAVGGLTAAEQSPAISHDLTRERARLRSVSTSAQPQGRICTLTFSQNTDAQDVTILGYELPVMPAGHR